MGDHQIPQKSHYTMNTLPQCICRAARASIGPASAKRALPVAVGTFARTGTRSLSALSNARASTSRGPASLHGRGQSAIRQPWQYQQARTMFLQTETTPNEDSIKFIPGQPLSETGQTHEFLSSQDARKSPLAISLFDIPGVKLVFFGPDFISITKTEDTQWPLLKPEIYATIIDHFSNGKPLFFEGHNDADGPEDTRILDTDSEVVAMIKELLDTRVRPAIQEDGGDIEYKGFSEDNGLVSVSLKGSCRGCDSSTVTLKNGIERMLMHYIPEVKGVEQILSAEESVAADEFEKFEARLRSGGKTVEI